MYLFSEIFSGVVCRFLNFISFSWWCLEIDFTLLLIARSIYRYANKPIDSVVHDHRKCNAGRSKKLCQQDERMLVITLFKLRNKTKLFKARRIKSEACIKHVSDRTVCRLLNKSNFRCLNCSKKGLLAKRDMRACSQFARKVIKFLPEDFWREGISFYFDGVGLTH